MTDEEFERLTASYAEASRRAKRTDDGRIEVDVLPLFDPNLHAPRLGCPSAEQVRSVWLQHDDWTAEQRRHIESCPRCRVYVPSLQRILAKLPSEAAHGPLRARNGTPNGSGAWRKLLGSLGSQRAALAGTAALVLVLAGVGYQRLADRDRDGASSLFATNLLDEHSDVLGTTRGEGGRRNDPIPLTPVATTLREGRPLFRWQGALGQRRYEILLWQNPRSPQEEQLPPVTAPGTSWRPSKPLQPGLYRWKVNVAGQISRDPGSLFKILDSSEIALIAEAEKRHAGSDEALAALYLKHGLLIEALGPLRRLHARTQDPRLVKYLKAAARAAGSTSGS